MSDTYSDLEDLSHADMLALRLAKRGDKAAQNKLAPFEHQAFAREVTKDSVVHGAAAVGMAPAYEGIKAIAMGKAMKSLPMPLNAAAAMGARKLLSFLEQPISDTTSDPSLRSVGRAALGFGQGLKSKLIGD